MYDVADLDTRSPFHRSVCTASCDRMARLNDDDDNNERRTAETSSEMPMRPAYDSASVGGTAENG